METPWKFTAVGQLYIEMGMYGGGTGTVEHLLGSKRGWTICDLEKRHPTTGLFASIFTKHRARGYVSLLILILLTTISGLGLEGYLKANAENRMVRREAQSKQALYVAEGGIEWAKAHLMVNPGLRSGSLSLDTGQVDIVIEASGGGYSVTAESHSGLASRRIRVILQPVAGKLVLENYQELHS